MVLKRGVQIGLGGMAGITRLRKEAEVREFQPFHQFGLLIEQREISPLLEEGMEEHETKQAQIDCDEDQKKIGFSHRRLFGPGT